MTFGDAARRLAQIFLAAQFISGKTGRAIFVPGGITPSTMLAQADAYLKAQAGAASRSLLPTTGPADVFDLSAVDPTRTVADILVAAGRQFTRPIILGGGEL
jgi:hypothetical protein